MKILLYVPAYNAAAHLEATMARVPAAFLDRVSEILIVDNASTDATATAAAACRTKYGQRVTNIRNASNLGYGGSQKLAYGHAQTHGHDLVVMLHADGQYAPELIGNIAGPIERGEADMVFGSRLAADPLKGNMPMHRYLGNRFLTALINAVLGWNLTEYHSGYRAYSVAALARLPLARNADYFHFDVEILVQLRAARMRVKEVPIPTHYGEEKSHLNVVRTGLAILGVLFEFVLHRHHLRRSLKYETA